MGGAEPRVPGRRLVVVGGAALALIVVAALVAAVVGRPPEDTVAATADDVAVPDARSDADGSGTIPAAEPSPGGGVGATPLTDARVECTRGEDVAAVPCVWWSAQLDRFPSTGAVVAGRTVAVGARPDVVGLDTRTGEARWRTAVGRVSGLVLARDGTGFLVWTDVGQLVVLEPFGGQIVWRAAVSVDVSDAALVQGWVVAATGDAVEGWPLDGAAEPWTVPVSGRPSRLAVGDGVVAVGDGNGEVRFIDVDTGSVRWSVDSGTWYVAVTPDGALVLTAGFGSPLVALDTRAGEIAWESPDVVGWAEVYVVPGTGRAVAQVGDDGALFVVDLVTGRLAAEERTLGGGGVAPRAVGATADGWVLMEMTDGFGAYDVQRADGGVGWALHLGGEPVGVPAVAYPRAPDAPMLVSVTVDGRVVATPVPPRVP